jgi:hypothetical protein
MQSLPDPVMGTLVIRRKAGLGRKPWTVTPTLNVVHASATRCNGANDAEEKA